MTINQMYVIDQIHPAKALAAFQVHPVRFTCTRSFRTIASEKMILKTEDHSTKSLINILGKPPRFVWILKASPSRACGMAFRNEFHLRH